MTYKELFETVKQKLTDSNQLLFVFAARDLITKINSIPSNPTSWQEFDIDGYGAVMLYSVFIRTLKDRAGQLASIEDDPVWQQATDVVAVLRETLIEIEVDGDIVLYEEEILSPSREMEAAGLLAITKGEDGRQYVELTPAGEAVAESVRQEIDRT